MSPDDIEYCACPDFLYENGKCSDCGKWIDDPREFSKSQRGIDKVQALRDGECECGIPSMNLNGVCEKCLRIVVLIDPREFFKSNDEKATMSEKEYQQDDNIALGGNLFCTSCGRSYVGDENFCGGCGQDVKRTTNVQQRTEISKASLPSTKKSGNGKMVLGIVLILGLLLLLYPSISKGGNSGGGNSNGNDGDSGGRWVSKCRTVSVPNPEYPGDQVPLSERIGISKFYTEQKCTDVYVP
jgi:hypothetical protein